MQANGKGRKKRKEGKRSGANLRVGRSRAEMTDRLTEQWGVEGVVLIVAMVTQDTFNLHIRGHEWRRGNLWKKLLPWLLPSRT